MMSGYGADFMQATSDAELLACASSPHKHIVINALSRLGDRVRTAVDDNGDSFLHLAVLNNTPGMIGVIVSHLEEKGSKNASILCKTVNYEGETPLLIEAKRGGGERVDVVNLLLPASLDCSIKPLTAKLNPEDVIRSYPDAQTNPILANNLRMACHAINAARKDARHSSTHPESNSATPEEKEKRHKAIDKLRTSLDGVNNYHVRREKIKSKSTANCEEYSDLCIAHLIEMKKDRNVRLEQVTFEEKNDDHMFVVMDRAEGSDINDPSTWGDNAVIVDAWSGLAFPASIREVSSKLTGHYNIMYGGEYAHLYNFVRLYNRDYHRLTSQFSFMCTPAFTTANCDFSTIPPTPVPRSSASCFCRLFSCCAKKKKTPVASVAVTPTFVETKAVHLKVSAGPKDPPSSLGLSSLSIAA